MKRLLVPALTLALAFGSVVVAQNTNSNTTEGNANASNGNMSNGNMGRRTRRRTRTRTRRGARRGRGHKTGMHHSGHGGHANANH